MNRLLFGIVCVVLGCSTRQPKHMASDATRGPSTAHDRANDRHCGLVAPAVLHEDGIGDLRIGRQVDSLRDRCDIVTDTTQLGEEALPERNIGVAIRGDIVNATIDSGRIWRIEVNSPGIRTADSLHVGSSLQQLLATGNAMGQEGEGILFVQLARHCGLSFRLAHELGESEHRQTWHLEDLRMLPPTTSVDQILVVGCGS